LNIVFFDSYEEAMENSALPELDAFCGTVAPLVDADPMFYYLDVPTDQTY